ncbi:MAG: hypothetical protein OXN97_08660 [Bryobacterales bacterium]|nr:hypothetical protein [Bryobacterales bacterium]
MDDGRFVLAAMSPAGGGSYSPAQIQKLLFLIDREISDLVGGSRFLFQPYHYGPFDKRVYAVLETLEDDGLVHIGDSWTNYRTYTLTPDGLESGRRAIEEFDTRARDYMVRASNFVREQTFDKLVAAIYKAYPEMRVNSVFQDR